MADKIIVPGGDITTHKTVDHATIRDMQIMMAFHSVAQKFGLCVVCLKCDRAVLGNNASPNAQTLSVACSCREIRADMTAPREQAT